MTTTLARMQETDMSHWSHRDYKLIGETDEAVGIRALRERQRVQVRDWLAVIDAGISFAAEHPDRVRALSRATRKVSTS